TLPNTVQWLDAAKAVEKDGVMTFHPVVHLMQETNAAVDDKKSLYLGGEVLSNLQEPQLMRDTLRHERGHVFHGDLDLQKPTTAAFRDSLEPADTLNSLLKEMRDLAQKPERIES